MYAAAGISFGVFLMMSFMNTVLVAILFLSLQKCFIKGITVGAVKGKNDDCEKVTADCGERTVCG